MNEVKTDDVVQALKSVGFTMHPRGSHATFRHYGGAQVTIPTGSRTISDSTLHAVARQASTVVSKERFWRLITNKSERRPN